MNTKKTFKLNPFLKVLPIILYYACWIPEIYSYKGPMTVADAAYVMFTATLALVLQGWGITFFVVFVFVRVKEQARKVMGIISIILGAITALWMFALGMMVYVVEGVKDVTMFAIVGLEVVLIGVSALILDGHVTT
jgi:hypothetical protein